MSNVFTDNPAYSILSTAQERSEREVLREHLRHLENMHKQTGSLIAQAKRRLAEIERATVERERAEAAA